MDKKNDGRNLQRFIQIVFSDYKHDGDILKAIRRLQARQAAIQWHNYKQQLLASEIKKKMEVLLNEQRKNL